jgi:hypothetical protein
MYMKKMFPTKKSIIFIIKKFNKNKIIKIIKKSIIFLIIIINGNTM